MVSQSGIITQASLAVLHDVNEGSGRLTQMPLECLYFEPYSAPTVSQSGLITQASLAVLHDVGDGSGRLTQEILEVLYTFQEKSVKVTQDVTQVVFNEQRGLVTQASLAVLHDVGDGSGRVTQTPIEVLYGPVQPIALKSTQDITQVAFNEQRGLVTQASLAVLHDVVDGS
jgi:hypothetical protein